MHVKKIIVSALISLFFCTASFAIDEFSPDSILSLMRKVAKFRMVTADTLDNQWNEGATFYPGIMAMYDLTKEKQYLDSVISWGKKYSWKPFETDLTTNGDNQTCFQTYAEAYLVDSLATNNFMIQPADVNIANMFDKAPLANKRWAWCDLMYMAPSGILRLARATHKTRYVDSMNVYWWNSSAVYYTADHLYWRDLNRKTKYWARGNGWVFGGLSRVIPYLPANYSARSKYITQFQEMAAKLKSIQRSTGLWTSNLLDSAEFPQKETSGSSFFCFGLAWGINYGILDKAQYEPVVRKAWTALVGCLNPNGSLGWVQGDAAAPGSSSQGTSKPYADGTFLLAAKEMHKLVNGTSTINKSFQQNQVTTRTQKGWQTIIVHTGLQSIIAPKDAVGYEMYSLLGTKMSAKHFTGKNGLNTITFDNATQSACIIKYLTK